MGLVTLPQIERSSASPAQRVKYIRTIDQVKGIPPAEREKLKKVAERYVFRANDYYLGLINWDDPRDPIKQLIIPREEELHDWGKLFFAFVMLWVGDLREESDVGEVLESMTSEIGLDSAVVRQTATLEGGTASWIDGAGDLRLGREGRDRRRAGVVERDGSKFVFIIVSTAEGDSNRLIDETTQLTIRTVARAERASR